jgi:D-alanyl-D-alanine carboxypeptidase (penicillin-binding protein 5/6)
MTQNSEFQENLTDTPYEQVLFVPSKNSTEVPAHSATSSKDTLLALFGAITLTGIVVAVSIFVSIETSPEPEFTAVVPKIQENVPKPPEVPNPYDALSLQAKAVIVYDVNEGITLFGRNEKKVLPLASLTKLMTGLVAVESLSLKNNIAISSSALETEGDSGLLVNESWKVSDLLSFTMITSSNDGADALATAAGSLWESTPEVAENYASVQTFVERMNIRAQEMGLQDTRFMNATGLDEPGGGGAGTATDVSKLLTYIWENEPSVILYTNEYQKTFISEDGFLHPAENTNEIVYEIPGLLGGKTGFTDLAGGNLAVIYDAGLDHPIVIVVLGSTLDGRFSDVKKLVDATYEYHSSGWADYNRVAGSTVENIHQ